MIPLNCVKTSQLSRLVREGGVASMASTFAEQERRPSCPEMLSNPGAAAPRKIGRRFLSMSSLPAAVPLVEVSPPSQVKPTVEYTHRPTGGSLCYLEIDDPVQVS